MEDIGILLLGIGAIAMGIYHVTRRKYVALDEIGSVIGSYRGAAVVCQGLSECFLGVGVASLGLVRVMGTSDTAGTWLATRPWPWLVCASLAALFFGGFMMLGSVEQRRSRGRFLVSLPGRVLGVLLILVALGGLALGAYDVVAPAEFHRGVETLRSVLPHDMPGAAER